ncbi:MAG TPA: 6-phosphofructokinase [Anaerolineales bacterium]|nr:6-phosphofructokinase [Anaerolineales bacterium]
MSKRVAILTGGGDVPGLNMCLKSLVYRLIDQGYEPIGVRKGWEGLIRYDPHSPTTYSENFIELTKNMVRPIDRTPGSFLHSSRMDPLKAPAQILPAASRKDDTPIQDSSQHILDVIQRLDYHALVVIGDDDMLMYAAQLSQNGAPIVAIPKTIYNNIQGTDYSLGFSTGLARGVSFIHDLRALAGSREQVIVIETFAARSGYSALLLGILAGVDRVLIPETPYNPQHLADLATQDKRENPANYAVILVTDGAHPQAIEGEAYTSLLNGSKGLSSGEVAAALLTELTGEQAFVQQLTYLLRVGPPDGQDLLGAANFAFLAADLVKLGRFGRMTAFVKDRMWTDVDLQLASHGPRLVDTGSMYDADLYKPRLELIWSLA